MIAPPKFSACLWMLVPGIALALIPDRLAAADDGLEKLFGKREQTKASAQAKVEELKSKLPGRHETASV